MMTTNQKKGLLLTAIGVFCLFPLLAQDTANRKDTSEWQVTPAQYPDNMILTAVLEVEGVESLDTNDIVAAFWGDTDQIRGLAQPFYVPGVDRYILSMFIYSEASPPADSITFEVYDASLGRVLPSKTTLFYASETPVGSFGNPFVISSINLEFSFKTDPVLCLADTLGWAVVEISGGDPPYTLEWSTGSDTDSIYHLSAGRYYITVTEGNDFSKTDSIDILNLNRPIIPPTLAVAPNDTLCEGQDVFAFAFSPETESPAYLWYDNFGNFVHEGDALYLPEIPVSREFDVITEVRNCLSEPSNMELEVQPVPEAGFMINNTEPILFETVIFTPEVIDAQYEYFWDFGDGTNSAVPQASHEYSAEGNYLVRLFITTPDGCIVSSSAFLDVDAKTIDVLFNAQPPLCPSDSSGSITAQAINGTPPYSYAWSSGDTASTAVGLPAGLYQLTVTDVQGNQRISEYELVAEEPLSAPEIVVNGENTLCAGDELVLSAFSSRDDVEIRWYADSLATEPLYTGSAVTLSGLQSGLTLWAEARIGGCVSVERTPAVVETERPSASFTANTQVTFPNDTLMLTATDTTAGLSYLWRFGDGNQAMGQTAAHAYDAPGVYEITLEVATENACSISQSKGVNILSGSMALQLQSEEASCASASDGKLRVAVGNGQPPYSYQWSTGATSDTLSGLQAGNYSVTVTGSLPFEFHPFNWSGAEFVQVSVADFNHDGKPDVLAATAQEIWAFRQTGQQNFSAELLMDTLQGIVALQARATGLAGLLLYDNGEILAELTTDSLGALQLHIIDTLQHPACQLRYLDLDEDEDYDALLGADNGAYWYANEPGLGWYARTLPDVDLLPSQVATLRAGGAVGHDLAVLADGQISVYRQYDTGVFAKEALPIEDMGAIWAGEDYLLAAPLQAGSPVVLIELEGGVTTRSLFTADQAPSSLFGADISGDGQLDVFMEMPDGTVVWYEQQQNGNYLPRLSPNAEITAPLHGLADFNTDGLPDLLSDNLSWHENRSGKGLTASAEAVLSANTDAVPPPSVAGGGTYCEGDELTLSAFTANPGARVRWYASAEGGQPWYEGPQLQLAGLDSSRVMWAESQFAGCISESRTPVSIVVEQPDASFTLDTLIALVGDSLHAAVDHPQDGHSYHWTWEAGTAEGTEAALAIQWPGVYSLRLEDRSPAGCLAYSLQQINVSDGGLAAQVAIEPPGCQGNDGRVQAQVSGGVPPYSYAWSTGSEGPVAAGLPAGAYQLTVSDAAGASVAVQFSVEEGPSPVGPPMISGGGAYCAGEVATLSAFAAEGAAVRWYEDEQASIPVYEGTQLSLHGLSEGRTLWAEARLGGCVSDRQQVVVSILEPEVEIIGSSFTAQPGENLILNAAPDGYSAYSWSFGGGSEANGPGPHTIAYENAGTYTIHLTATDAEGCQAEAYRQANIWEGNLSVTAETTPASCQGDPSGRIVLQVQGALPPYAYSWSNGGATAVQDNLLPGIYEVTVSSADGFTQTASIPLEAAAPAPSSPTLIINGGNTLCRGEDTYINAYSDDPQAVFYWYEELSSPNPIHVGPTLYLFNIQQSEDYFVEARLGGCVSARAEAGVQISAPDASFTTSVEVAFTGQAIQFTVLNTAFGTSYTWDWGDNTQDGQLAAMQHAFDVAGIYEVQLTARNTITGCEDVQHIRIQVVDLPGGGNSGEEGQLYALPLSEPARCAGSPTGQAAAAAFGGQPPYSYQWSNGSTEPLITGLLPGDYGLTVTDSAGSTASGSTTVAASGPLPAPSAIVNGGQPACLGEPLWLAASSGRPGAQYLWYESPAAPQPLYAGAAVQHTSAQPQDTLYLLAALEGCFSELTEIIVQYELADAGFSLSPATAQPGQAVSFEADSLTAAYGYAWSFGDGQGGSGPQASHAYSEPGLYEAYLEVSTANGCTGRQRRFVNVISPAGGQFAAALQAEHPHCPQDETGSLSPLLSGGQPPYSYEWSTGSTAGSLLGIGPGTYGLTVTDASGQQAVAEAELLSLQPEIPAPLAGLAGGGTACQGGSAWLSATGGEPGTQYYWYDAPAGGSLLFTGSYLELNNLQENQALFAEARYEGCTSASRTPAFVELEAADASFTVQPAVVPAGELVSAEALGGPGQSYSWSFGGGAGASGSQASHAYAAPGFYEVTLQAATPGGCTAEQRRTVQVAAQQELQLSAAVELCSCAGSADGAIALSLSGGQPPYSIAWAGGSTEAQRAGLLPGSYALTVTDGAGNSLEEEIALGSAVGELAVEETALSGAQAPCRGSEALLLASANEPAAQVYWYDAPAGGSLLYIGSSYPALLGTDTLTVYAEARLGSCRSPQRAALEVVASGPDASFSYSPAAPVPGEPASFEAAAQGPGYSYFWSFGGGSTSTEVSPVHAFAEDGVFEVSLEVAGPQGCAASSSQLITAGFGTQLGLSLQPEDAQCAGSPDGAIAAQAANGTPPYAISWSTGAQGEFVQGLLPGAYSATVTDAAGNTAVAEAQVGSATGPVPAPQAAANNTVLCPGEVLILYAFDNSGTASNFYWYDAPEGGSLLGAGSTFSQQGLASEVQVFYAEAASGGCRSASRTAVTVEEERPNQGFTASANTAAVGSPVSFAPALADSSYAYEWRFGDGVASVAMSPSHAYSSPGQYTVSLEATSPGGCSQRIEEPAFVEVVPDGALAILFDISQPACAGDSTGAVSAQVLNGIPPYSFEWSNGSTASSISGLPAGQYSLTVTGQSGASAQRTASVSALFQTPAPPTVSPGPGAPLCAGQAQLLTASSSQAVDAYYWYSGGQLLGSGFSMAVEPQGQQYPIEVEAQRGSCFSERAELQYSVQQLGAGFTASGLEAGSPSVFVPQQQSYASYEWSFGDGSTSAQMQPQHTYAAAGEYEVRLRVQSHAGCREEAVQLITVVESQGLELSFSTQHVRCAQSTAGAITAQAQGGQPPYAYAWEGGQAGAERSSLAAGAYTVTATDAAGAQAVGTAEVLNLDSPPAAPEILANGGAPACLGEPAYLSAQAPGEPQAEIRWYAGPADTAALHTGPSLVIPALAAPLAVYAETRAGGCASPRAEAGVEPQAPQAGFSIDPGSNIEEGELVQLLPEANDELYSYYWEFGDGGWSTQRQPFYFYNLPGEFSVSLEVTDADGCTGRLEKPGWVEVSPWGGLQGGEAIDTRSSAAQGSRQIAARAFPNPFSQQLSAVVKARKPGRYRVQLVDALGRVQRQEEALLAGPQQAWALSMEAGSLQPGFYLLRISGQGEQAAVKLVKP